jgi:hypothetical protein
MSVNYVLYDLINRKTKIFLKLFLISLLSQFHVKVFSQNLAKDVIQLPIELDIELRGIRGKLILDSIQGKPTGIFSWFRIGFQKSDTKGWVWLQGNEVQLFEGKLPPVFEVELVEDQDAADRYHLLQIISPTPVPRRYRWQCDCVNELPKIVL